MKSRRQASFTRLQDCSRQDYLELLLPEEIAMARGLADRVLAHLRLLDGDAGGYPVNRFQHSLQAATLALEDGRDDEYVICALLHDIGDSLGAYNHPDIAAAILKPFVGEANLWMVQHHGIFQGFNFFHHIGLDRHMRDQFIGHPHYERTREFVERYDDPAFDPARITLPLSHFEPILHRLMASPTDSVFKTVLEAHPRPT
jgi:predicted HD phosphohydrolase